jgi:hypothetical protein
MMWRMSVAGPETTAAGGAAPGARPPPPFPGLALAGLVALASVALAGCPRDDIQDTLPPGVRVDAFSQVAVTKVDVLWVVDNSGSMAQEQENLGRNFGRFFEFLAKAKVDYHIAITTTDLVADAGRLKGSPAVIDPNTPDPVAAFAANVKVGIDGSANEAGLDAARRTFELRPAGFLREDAHLFLIFVSDEEDRSAPGTPKYFYRYFEGLKGKGNESMVSAGAIVGDVPGGCASPVDGYLANAGSRYKQVVDAVGGTVGSICDSQFDATLVRMGVDAVGLKRKFTLSKTPDLPSVEVKVGYPCDASADDLAVCASTNRDACASGGTIACTVRPLPARKGCDVPDAELAGGCGRVQRFCERDDPFVWCYPSAGGDGWEYEESTSTLVFHGAALPPKGAPIEIVYQERERVVTP